jgi:gliding motility-associated-like protein
MKKVILLISILSLSLSIFAQQNLIPNPSFEEYDCIPDSKDDFDCVKEWYNPSSQTTDYLHKLAPHYTNSINSVNIPYTWRGYQPSADGDAFMLAHMSFSNGNRREYAAVPLLEPLVKGQEYEISFLTARAPQTPALSWRIASNGQGVLFTTYKVERRGDTIVQEPHFFNPKVIENAYLTWEEVGGTFIADDAHRYMLVGNFLSLYDPRFKRNTTENPRYKNISYFYDRFRLVATDRKFSIDYVKENNCFPVTVTFTPNNIDTATYWKWNFHDGTLSYDEIAQKTFNEPGTYTIRLETTEKGKTYHYEKVITLEQNPLPTADFEANERLAMNSPIQFENLSENAVYFEWDFGDGNTSTEANPWHTYTQPNDYLVTLIAYNEDDCADTIQYPFYISCSGRMNVNVFTPNNDGRNDDYSFDSLQICENFSIQIFNRWGGLVFENQDPYRPWDGGNEPSGTYYYIIRYRGGGQEKGFITLIR